MIDALLYWLAVTWVILLKFGVCLGGVELSGANMALFLLIRLGIMTSCGGAMV
jgi:hypothetical protein